jgi:hypothetical protein
MSVTFNCTLPIHSQINVYSHYSYNKRDIEHLLSLTDSFTWEELPTRDPDTGYLTNAGYIPIIQVLTKIITALMIVFDATETTVPIVMNHGMLLTTWYPFDVSLSPIYETANLTQVVSNKQFY